MKRMVLILLVAIAASLIGTQAYGHHSFAATYFVDQEVTVEARSRSSCIATRTRS